MTNQTPDPAAPELSVLILHGWQNRRPPGHWHRWLADTLTGLGHQVVYPQLPEPDEPVLTDWLDAAEAGFRELAGRQRVVVTHSLGCLAWLHLANDPAREVLADRLALVVPPSPVVIGAESEVAAFAFAPTADRTIRSGAREGVVVFSDNDPYDPEGSGAKLGEPLGLRSVPLPGQAHLNIDSGYGEWPAMLAWCLDPTTPITPREPDDALRQDRS
jgi:predicted alpha/beta hydrolase family esterase